MAHDAAMSAAAGRHVLRLLGVAGPGLTGSATIGTLRRRSFGQSPVRIPGWAHRHKPFSTDRVFRFSGTMTGSEPSPALSFGKRTDQGHSIGARSSGGVVGTKRFRRQSPRAGMISP